ncbi:MAG: hypothetical protein AAF090_16160 [Bacteroidota bacterium]
MKTKISKKNALKVIDTFMRFQTLMDRLNKISDDAFGSYCGGFAPLEAVLNIKFSKMHAEEYSKYLYSFNQIVENDDLDYEEKSLVLYRTFRELNDSE